MKNNNNNILDDRNRLQKVTLRWLIHYYANEPLARAMASIKVRNGYRGLAAKARVRILRKYVDRMAAICPDTIDKTMARFTIAMIRLGLDRATIKAAILDNDDRYAYRPCYDLVYELVCELKSEPYQPDTLIQALAKNIQILKEGQSNGK